MIEKKILRVVAFTTNGKNLIDKIAKDDRFIIESKSDEASLSEWTGDCFKMHLPILFVSSVGIAVRTIAPFVSDKLKDSPVIVVDELGHNIIPILSGHFGGANALAWEIAEVLGANPIITTATDINNVFAVDVFAKENGLLITDKSLIKKVSTLALAGEKLHVIEKDGQIDIEGLKLIPKRVVLGIGCKRGKTFQELHEFINRFYEDDYLFNNLYAICSIDVKADEMGLIKLAQFYGVRFLTFSSEELDSLQGDFSNSQFVKEKVGTGNVCERSAILGAGEKSYLVMNKYASDGITLAEAKREKIELKW